MLVWLFALVLNKKQHKSTDAHIPSPVIATLFHEEPIIWDYHLNHLFEPRDFIPFEL